MMPQDMGVKRSTAVLMICNEDQMHTQKVKTVATVTVVNLGGFALKST